MNEPEMEKPQDFEKIIQSISIGVCVIDSDGIIQFNNKVLCQVFGAEMDEIQGSKLLDFIDDQANVLQSYFQSDDPGKLDEIECKLTQRIGQERHIHISIVPYSHQGDSKGFICSIHDSTDFIQLQLSLIREFAFQSEVSDMSNELRASVDILDIAKKTTSCIFHHTDFVLTGFIYVVETEREEINEWIAREKFHGANRITAFLRSRLNPILNYTKNNKDVFKSGDLKFWTADDFEETTRSKYEILDSISILGIPFSVEGHGRGFLIGCYPLDLQKQEDLSRIQYVSSIASASIQNLHLLKQIQEKNEKLALTVDELQRADLLREQFYRFLMHDLNKPLAAISGTAGRMIRKDMDAKVLTRLKRIYRSSLKLQGYVGELLDFERIRRGEVQFKIRPFDVVSEVLEACETIQERFEDCVIKFRGIKVQHIMSSELKFTSEIIESDEEFVQRVFLNILDNAGKYGNGQIEVDLKQSADYIEVSIWNDGKPISKQDQDKLFVEFYQEGKIKSGSYGIGLASVKRLVQNLSGRIKVQPEDNGTTFIVVLPCRWMKTARVSTPTG